MKKDKSTKNMNIQKKKISFIVLISLPFFMIRQTAFNKKGIDYTFMIKL